MKKTIVYIDGFNLYYGLLRSSKNKWLDVVAFANSLLPRPDEHEILAVKYFTARVNYDPAEPTAQMRQSVYLSADLRPLFEFLRLKNPFDKIAVLDSVSCEVHRV